MGAKPEELTLMLFDGVVKFITQAKLFNDQKNIEKSSNANLRAQAIIQELRSTLNMDIEMSSTFEDLYLFMNRRLVDANISKDNKMLDEVLELVTDLRDTWKIAMKL
jgi:flagellar protein FliS